MTLVWRNNIAWLDVLDGGGGPVPKVKRSRVSGASFGWTLKRTLIDVSFSAVLDPNDFGSMITGWAPQLYGVRLSDPSAGEPDNLTPLQEPDDDWLWTETLHPHWTIVDHLGWLGSPPVLATAHPWFHIQGYTTNTRDTHGQRAIDYANVDLYFAGTSLQIGGASSSLAPIPSCNAFANIRTLWNT